MTLQLIIRLNAKSHCYQVMEEETMCLKMENRTIITEYVVRTMIV